jgi:nitroimidazol reductase NimA-like FMN-containing flavoprotein (pyridoxamine 5'-phosphate oxidase superfamily)
MERREFVRKHRTCVFGYNRQNDGPAMTVVYYVLDGDDLLVSTMAARAKALAVQRSTKVSLCILNEQWPLTYLQVYGTPRSRRTSVRRWTCCAGSST